nr:MAG TPA: hypothetical protein [Crassvirales sp.]
MERFNLDEYLKHPERKVVTRDGRRVRIVCTDREATQWPIVALVRDKNEENIYSYSLGGVCSPMPIVDDDDLFFAPEKKEGWINIYKYNSKITPGSQVYNTKEEAESAKGAGLVDYISTIKIQWEE